MKNPLEVWILRVLGLVLALPLAVACGSDSQAGDGGNGGGNGRAPAQTPLGQELEGIAELGDEIIGQNAEAYEGLDFAADALESLFGAQAASAALSSKQVGGPGCIPPQLQNATFVYDPPSQTYTSMQIPGGPEGGVRVLIYDVSGGAPNTDNNIGNLDITCSGTFPTFNVTANLNVNDDVVLNINGNLNIFDVSSYQVTVGGFLRTADGSQQINFGEESSGGSFSSFDTSSNSSFGVDFIVGEGVHGVLTRFLSVDPSFSDENVLIKVFKEGVTPDPFGTVLFEDFAFDASLTPTGGGTLSGPGTFFLNPELGGSGGIDQVACLEGTFDNMSVTPASESCQMFSEGYDLVPLPQTDLDAMERAYEALQGMYSAVEGVTSAGASIALSAAAQTFQ
jgi:hypothetical protein